MFENPDDPLIKVNYSSSGLKSNLSWDDYLFRIFFVGDWTSLIGGDGSEITSLKRIRVVVLSEGDEEIHSFHKLRYQLCPLLFEELKI